MITRRRELLERPESPEVRAELLELAEERRTAFAEWLDLAEETRDLRRAGERHAASGRSLEREETRREGTTGSEVRKPLVIRLVEADRRALARFEEWREADERRYRRLRANLGLTTDEDHGRSDEVAVHGRVERQVAELWDMCWGEFSV